MLYASIFTSERERDPELWATIWQRAAPPSLNLIGAYNLAGNQRLYLWEGDSVADLQFMDAFNDVGVLETFPAFDRSAGWRAAFTGDLEGFSAMMQSGRGPLPRAERAIDLRRRGLEAPNPYAARRAALEWMAEMESEGDDE
ncbi:MAG: hypothetical protein QF664_13375 [Dehalococcoidia bacterium]|jgi:hypothetical protein|nr:hypothetical protein [Dehalococcoidia bacterium]